MQEQEKQLTRTGAVYLAIIAFAAPWLLAGFCYGAGFAATGFHFMRAAWGG